MRDFLQTLLETLQGSPELVVMAVLAAGVLTVVIGVAGMFGGTSAEVRRMRAGAAAAQPGGGMDLVQDDDLNRGGLSAAFVPSSESERTRVARRLRKAGVQRKNAVYLYYAIRTLLAVGLPGAYLALGLLPPDVQSLLPPWLNPTGVGWAVVFQTAIGLSVMGFYGPAIWLHLRIRERRKRIRYSLPNALDLLHVAIEAGLGFDAAMLRVAREMARVAPEVSQEFMMLQLEIQAGKDRHLAFLEMAERTDLEEMKAFAHVILQAGKFGSSVSDALDVFANEIRLDRELKAQEKANRLPVQMSAVLSLCMMPVLLMICLAPMVIRWSRIFAETSP